MRRPRPLVRLQALVLVALTGALSSGLPSHHHTDEAGPVFADADHHGHGVLVVEQSERLKSPSVGAALPATAVVTVTEPPAEGVTLTVEPRPAIARSRPPPTDLPRAPPVSV